MTNLVSMDQINRIIRAKIIEQLNIDASMVRDLEYLYGADLDKSTDNVDFESIEPGQSLVVFAIDPMPSGNNTSQTIDDKIVVTQQFVCRIIIYGDESDMDATILSARLRTEKVRDDLYASGLFVESVSEINEVNEFMNASIWTRHDFTINLACEFTLDQVTDYPDFAALNKLTIIEKEN